MKKKLYMALTALLALTAAVCAAVILRNTAEEQAGEASYVEAARTAGLLVRPGTAADAPEEEDTPDAEDMPDTPDAPPEESLEDRLALLAQVDLEALRAVNPQVIGWIEIPFTGISYPLLQGEDNQYYLKHTWSGESSSAGAIFMECTNRPDRSDFNTIIYGHKLRSGAMFAALKSYDDGGAYWKAHPSVYIADDGGLHRYDIFAAHAVGVEEIVYRLDLGSMERREEFLSFCLERSVIDTGITPEASDRILTLSTCTGSGYAKRWVVQAVLAEET